MHSLRMYEVVLDEGYQYTPVELDTCVDLAVKRMACTLEAATLCPDGKTLALGLPMFQMAVYWSVGSRRFMNAGVVKNMGGVDTLLEACRHYDLQNCGKYTNNAAQFDVFFGSMLVIPLLVTFGQILTWTIVLS